MGKYYSFTEEERLRANNTDLEVFLRSMGEVLLPSGSEKRLASDHSVTIRGNKWYDFAHPDGGYPIEFVKRKYHLKYGEAVHLLLQNGAPIEPKEYIPPSKFVPPVANSDMRRVFAYLTKCRKIDYDIVCAFVKNHLLYEDAEYHNAVFVGRDEQGNPRHAQLHSTYSNGKTVKYNAADSDSRYMFHHYGGDELLFVFESPIDLMSMATISGEGWEKHNYISCNGLAFLPVNQALATCPQVKTVYICFDNDRAGEQASARLQTVLEVRGYEVVRFAPKYKDWNEDLVRESEAKYGG